MTKLPKTKKFIKAYVATIVICLGFTAPVTQASPSATLGLSPSSPTTAEGSDITLTIYANSDVSVASAQACIIIDTSKVSYKSTDTSLSALESEGSTSCPAGEITISRSGNSAGGTFILATITLTAISSGTTAVSFSADSYIRGLDADYNPVDIMGSAASSTLTISAPLSPSPASETTPGPATLASAAVATPVTEAKKEEVKPGQAKQEEKGVADVISNPAVLSSSIGLADPTILAVARVPGFKPLPFILAGSVIVLLGGSALAFYYIRKTRSSPKPVIQLDEIPIPANVQAASNSVSLVPASPPLRVRVEQTLQPRRTLRPRDL